MFIAHGICKYLKAPEGRHVLKRKVGKRGVGGVGVGSPNPFGRGNLAPTIGIAFRSRGAICL